MAFDATHKCPCVHLKVTNRCELPIADITLALTLTRKRGSVCQHVELAAWTPFATTALRHSRLAAAPRVHATGLGCAALRYCSHWRCSCLV